MIVLLTGATGFVGQVLARLISARGHRTIPVVRNALGLAQEIVVPEINEEVHWASSLRDCAVVIHLAARTHLMREKAMDSWAAYCTVNTDGTLNLARQAAEAGVKRFIFVSSIKVNGERTLAGEVFKSTDVPCPEDLYAISKHNAEVGLRQLSADTGMEVVIVRPPLVYGPGVKGNFANMVHCLQRGMPLPFGMVTKNQRSLVALDNLTDLLLTCIDHPAAANQTFLVSDGEDLSTADLLRRLAAAMGQPSHLLPVPTFLLEAGAKLLGKSDMAQRLVGNLQVDISHTCETLGWKPSISVDEGLRRTVEELRK